MTEVADGTRHPVGERLEGAIEHHADVEDAVARGERRRPTRRSIIRIAGWLTVTGVSLYLVAPAVLETTSSWRRLADLAPGWFAATAGLQVASVAAGATARPALVLLAFCAAQLLSQAPLTPGGLGLVEAELTAMLTLAGVGAADAVLTTFAYRLMTHWLPMPAGLVGALLYRRRYAGQPGAVAP